MGTGKIMRRVIAAVSNFMDVGDVTTLANPEVVETIRKMVQAEKGSTRRGSKGPSQRGARRNQAVWRNRIEGSRG